MRNERRPEQEILGGIASERKLGERHEIAAGGVGALVGVEHAIDVAVDITDD